MDNNFDSGTDTDGDGLIDAQEILYGTSITKNDSDNDGLPDKIEIDAGLDPISDDSLIIQTAKKYFFEEGYNQSSNLKSTLTPIIGVLPTGNGLDVDQLAIVSLLLQIFL